MHEVQLRDAKARLLALVEGAAHGEMTIITRYGKPRAVILGIDEWKRFCQIAVLWSVATLCVLPKDFIR